MKENFTTIAVILDKSSSMSTLREETICSFNKFLKEQKETPGEVSFMLGVFSHNYNTVYDFVPLQEVSELNDEIYITRGSTALLDAMGITIDNLGQKLSNLPENQRPSKVLVLVITDGEENASSKFSLEQIKEKVQHQQEVYNWTFVFIGANIDAFQVGGSLGVSTNNSLQYIPTAAGTNEMYNVVSRNTIRYRSSIDSRTANFFDDKDKN